MMTIDNVVSVFTNPVSINVPVIAISPFLEGSEDLEADWAIPADPNPDSLESRPRRTPIWITCFMDVPTIAPPTAFIENADLILVIGSKLGELVTSRWSIIPKDVPLIQCDIDPNEINRNYNSSVGVVADARSFINDLLECLGTKNFSDLKIKPNDIKDLKDLSFLPILPPLLDQPPDLFLLPKLVHKLQITAGSP